MRTPRMHLANALALAAAVTLATACDVERDTGAIDDDQVPDAALPDPGAPPVDMPPPVPGPAPDDGHDLPGADATVPTRFQGSYAADQGACDTAGHETHLDIASDRITFHESSGPVTAVASGPSDITITAELTGEGETRESTYRFRLSDDGKALTDLGAGMERVRCD